MLLHISSYKQFAPWHFIPTSFLAMYKASNSAEAECASGDVNFSVRVDLEV